MAKQPERLGLRMRAFEAIGREGEGCRADLAIRRGEDVIEDGCRRRRQLHPDQQAGEVNRGERAPVA